MAIKIKKAVLTALWSMLITALLTGSAFAKELMVGGQVVGVQISTRGVIVAGVSEVETKSGICSPAKNAGICQGDLIIKVDGIDINKASQVIEAVEAKSGKAVSLTVQRDGKVLEFTVEPVCSAEGQWMLGMWLRDGVSGIGTLTFLEPESGVYGALGHSVSDSETGKLIPIDQGSITDAQIVSIKPGNAGNPGELNGCADLGKVLGSIRLNTECGIYGQMYSAVGGRRIESGMIAAGPATIISTLSGRDSGEYAVEINRVYNDGNGIHAMLSVVDPTLLEKTGGIVQGMSGSPIIQNGKLVGAVTHVFVSDPTRGYAISIQDMLAAAGIEEKAA